ncbi:hypothetical protein GE061_000244 [Apolygus lucorum]|uniref:ATP-dependent DNA helicase n=1 Tax=Apolygus lucorum TaxID=248454 RepID=A0A8S9Y591_APOLU|nr:hypothetical protein GE061_000244 [Apolygus lucorum]
MMARAEGLTRQALAEIYRHRRRAYTKSIRVAKKEAWQKLVTTRGRGGPWGLPYKLVSGKRKPAGIFITQEDSTWTEAASRLLNALVPDDSTVAENRDHQRIRDYVNEGPTSSNEEPLAFSQEEIKNAIWQCAKKKAPGEDSVTAEILRAAWVSAKERLTALYNSSVAYYVAKYASKCEPHDLEKLLDKPFQWLKDKAVYGSSFSPSRWLSHLSVWDENDLLFEGETTEACFLRRQNELRPLLGNLSAEQFAYMEAVIQQTIAQAVALNTGRLPNDAEPSNFQIPNLAPDKEKEWKEEEGNDPNDFCEEPIPTSVMPDDVYHTSVQHLNIQQKNLFRNVSAAIEKDIAKQDNQLLLFITGGAGSGKSFLLKLIVEHISHPSWNTVTSQNLPFSVCDGIQPGKVSSLFVE